MEITVRIRQLTAADAASLAALGRATFEETYRATQTRENLESYVGRMFSLERIQEELAGPRARFYLAERAGESAGFIKLRDDRSTEALKEKKSVEVERIYVRSAFHGLGVGKALMQAAKEAAAAEAREAIWLQVWQENAKAIRFYEKAGFRICGTATFQLGDDLMQDYVMCHDLGRTPP